MLAVERTASLSDNDVQSRIEAAMQAPKVSETALVLMLLRESSVVSSADARDLRAYFGTDGVSSVDRSPLAGMLARAQLFRGHTLPCLKCGGDRAGGNLERQRGGCGLACTPRQRSRLKLLGLYPPTDDKCPACKGTGWIVRGVHRHRRSEITARPTGSSIRASGAPWACASDADMHLLGSISRRLAVAESILTGASAVLELFYGTPAVDGGRRLTGLWSLTAAGKKLLARNRIKDLDPVRFFENERELELIKPSLARRALFRAADIQASDLRRQAAKAWNLARRLRGRL